jgi:hypothetical protein
VHSLDVLQVGPEGILAFNSSSTDTGNSIVNGVMIQSAAAAAAATAGIEFASAVHNKLLFALPDTTAITAGTDADTAASANSDAMITTDATTADTNGSTAIVSAATTNANKSSVRPICENSATRRVAFEVLTYTYLYLFSYLRHI